MRIISSSLPARPYRRIATEEAFSPPEMLDIYKRILAKDDVDTGFKHLMGFYMSSPSERATHIMRCLTDLNALRLQHMDEAGADVQVIGLTSPGVQIMDKDTAVAFAPVANDILAGAMRRHPDRLVGMIAVAPQDPAAAAKEIQSGDRLFCMWRSAKMQRIPRWPNSMAKPRPTGPPPLIMTSVTSGAGVGLVI